MMFWEKLAIGACLLIAAFGGGYYVATGQYEDKLIKAAAAQVVAQHERDVAQTEQAKALSQLVEARRKAAAVVDQTVAAKIEALPAVVTSACEVTIDALKLLNEAAQ